mmetsp:Transcript_27925/g.24585  ORF Transcript_27925/g.24585 Transcript_27925/m.24585 type:complete len:98 (-) Transcript_27925:909-1202(-)|eukprot:CAMPEP_0114590718 /NCGR_PEP_ID=MMETSP0125-20121206/12931_1 /TAXON_ID=485358 ORGANISM="Aristerostoma sp., Strain ATCC 50986" /NCGR_SAMPLE_ID=MMETSP0125 /ASSEMBLY_ACC=CAM_ASM_000245 /LENGTH=97 /DNA_ID=CAMNT_0001788415 /DNA_START=1389 /DNA_END=1682 /DNA_ORIENTATION=-
MHPLVKDICEKLLVRDPSKRLGAGIKGGDNDYSKLKAHPLFEGINWENMHQQKAPVNEVLSPHKRKKSSQSEEETITPKKKMSANELYDKVEKTPVE